MLGGDCGAGYVALSATGPLFEDTPFMRQAGMLPWIFGDAAKGSRYYILDLVFERWSMGSYVHVVLSGADLSLVAAVGGIEEGGNTLTSADSLRADFRLDSRAESADANAARIDDATAAVEDETDDGDEEEAAEDTTSGAGGILRISGIGVFGNVLSIRCSSSNSFAEPPPSPPAHVAPPPLASEAFSWATASVASPPPPTAQLGAPSAHLRSSPHHVHPTRPPGRAHEGALEDVELELSEASSQYGLPTVLLGGVGLMLLFGLLLLGLLRRCGGSRGYQKAATGSARARGASDGSPRTRRKRDGRRLQRGSASAYGALEAGSAVETDDDDDGSTAGSQIGLSSPHAR